LSAKIGETLTQQVKKQLIERSDYPLVTLSEPDKLTIPFPQSVLALLAAASTHSQMKDQVFGQTEFLKQLKDFSPLLEWKKLEQVYGQGQADQILKMIVQQSSNKAPSQLHNNSWSKPAIEEALFSDNSGQFRALFYLLAIFCTLLIAAGLILLLTAATHTITRILTGSPGDDKPYVETMHEAIKKAIEGSSASRVAAVGVITTTAAVGAGALMANQFSSTPGVRPMALRGGAPIYRTFNYPGSPGDTNNPFIEGDTTYQGSTYGDTYGGNPYSDNRQLTAASQQQLTKAIEALKTANERLVDLLKRRPPTGGPARLDSASSNLIQQALTENGETLKQLASLRRDGILQSYFSLMEMDDERKQIAFWLDNERRRMLEQQEKDRVETTTNLNSRTTELTKQINDIRTKTAGEIEDSLKKVSRAGTFQAELSRLRARRDVIDKVKQFFGGTTVYMLTDEKIEDLLDRKKTVCPGTMDCVTQADFRLLAWRPFIDVGLFVEALEASGVNGFPAKNKNKGAKNHCVVQEAIIK